MRRTTSASFTAILGVALTASMVSAQQLRESDRAARTGSDDSTSSAESTLYGMTAARGARYLLRNGLDYLNYEQYERALKFLREAESRQKELNNAEKRALKQGIERAQRGLRAAADGDAASPYAISERSRRRNGFTVAKPEVQVAADPNPARGSGQPADARRLGSEPDDQGEPIRLTSAEDHSAQAVAQDRAAMGETSNQAPRTSRQSKARHTSLPEIPKIPDFTSISDMTGATASRAPITSSTGAGESSPPPAGVTDRGEPAGLPKELTQEGAAQADSQPASAPSSGSPAPNLATVAPAVAPAPAPTPAPAQPTSSPAQPEELKPVSAVAGAGPPVATSASPEPSPKPSVIELETTPPATQADQGVKTDEAGALTQGEAVAATPPGVSAPDSVVASVPDKAPTSQPVDAQPANAGSQPAGDLPALPAAVAETAARNPMVAAGPSEASTPALSSPSPGTADELPPLPAELGRTGATETAPPASSANERPPARVEVGPVPPASIEPAAARGTSSAPLESLPGATGSANAEPASGPPSSDSDPVSLPPLPDDATAAAVQPGQHEAAVDQGPADREPPASPAAGTGAAGEGASSPPAGGAQAASESRFDPLLPRRPYPPSTLRPELQREVDRIARLQEEELQRRAISPPQPAPPPDSTSSDLRMQTQQDISRAPSPAEARPIKAIPVPEDWVPLGPREWTPQRKYWAAAATCHLPLYFQDPVLERYGHSVEQFFGPAGRYLTYPVDDPTQSTQRNQLLQPFFSAGLFGLQIIAWPYNLIMDPPWEAQYDLGYYRPGDRIPTDTYWLPLHGYGPPLQGSNY
ncbi:MAG: hypothetical protein ACLQIB_09985 [Isosphaeraceae bacterium]